LIGEFGNTRSSHDVLDVRSLWAWSKKNAASIDNRASMLQVNAIRNSNVPATFIYHYS